MSNGYTVNIGCIASGLFIAVYLTNKMNQSSRLGILIAGGTGICGVTAIMAIPRVIEAQDNAISYAVANITIFGLTGMILYTFLANILFVDDPIKARLFLGTVIHDTAQVKSSALIYAQNYDTTKIVK